MNINCINKCKYQKDGKCTFDLINGDYHLYKVGKKSECPYISVEIDNIIKEK